MSDDNVQILDDEKEILLDHNYDGIKELDNPLPMWWLFTFYGTIIFGFIYFIHYQFAGPSLSEELAMDLQQIELIKAQAPKKVLSEDNLKALFAKEDQIALGESIYTAKCAVCHGDQGQGTIGPNLTDQFWIHVKNRKDLVDIIRIGVVEKGMPAWDSLLKDQDIFQVAAFIMSLEGTSVPNPKPPQGEKVLIE